MCALILVMYGCLASSLTSHLTFPFLPPSLPPSFSSQLLPDPVPQPFGAHGIPHPPPRDLQCRGWCLHALPNHRPLARPAHFPLLCARQGAQVPLLFSLPPSLLSLSVCVCPPLGIFNAVAGAYMPSVTTDPSRDPLISPYFAHDKLLR